MWIVWLDGTVTFWHCDTMKVVQCNIGTFGRGLRVVLVKEPCLTNIINCITCTVVTVWHRDILTVWHFDGVKVRQFDSVAQWKYDTVITLGDRSQEKKGQAHHGQFLTVRDPFHWTLLQHCTVHCHYTAQYTGLSLYCTVQCTVTILHCTVHYH